MVLFRSGCLEGRVQIRKVGRGSTTMKSELILSSRMRVSKTTFDSFFFFTFFFYSGTVESSMQLEILQKRRQWSLNDI